jgi:polyisoprenoid-binding protein YceI
MATFKIDQAHSDILFKVKHLMITTVTGQFTSFEGEIESATEDFSDAKVSFTADVNSIDTRNEQRNEHLKSDDFFNAAEFPKVLFQNGSLSKSGENYSLIGDLTIRDTTKQVTLTVSYSGKMTDPWGQTKVGFEAEGVIKRKEFGLKWDTITEAGGVVVSDDVRLILNVQFTQQA